MDESEMYPTAVTGEEMMRPKRSVIIDAFPQSAFRHLERDAIVCIDVLRTTTTLVTSVSQNRPTFAAPNVEDALALAKNLDSPLLVGDVNGGVPVGFALMNSPSSIVSRKDTWRPLVLMSLPGTRLIANSAGCPAVYIASFQNVSATAEHLAANHNRVALLGAGSDDQPRCEDQMAAAWIAARLVDRGFEPEDMRTVDALSRWSTTDVSIISWGNSAADLREQGQEEDLKFVLKHVDDLDIICYYQRGEVRPLSTYRSGHVVKEVQGMSNLIAEAGGGK